MRIFPVLSVVLLAVRVAAQETSAKPDADPRKMLHSYLLAEAQKHFDARRQVIAKLQTPEDIAKRQVYLKGKFLEALGGFPEKTPLNPQVTGTIERDRFRVEKVIYESRPNHHVTGNLYIPVGKGPFPGVLMPCGHSANGKAAEAYQRVCILMAQHGMVVLCYDPIGQGERIQLLDKMGKPAIAGSTSEHTMVGIGALLVGQSCATYRIWDGIRSLGYLASRPEVDPKRLGCTGNSGGGTLTSYLMALDDRIVCAAPSCYLTTLEKLFTTIGPQDAEQNITGQVAFGMEHADYILMRAPKPTLMCVATKDFFDIGGARTTFQEATDIYRKMDAVRKVDFFEYEDGHGFSKPRREAAARWLKKWLVGVDEPISEGDFPSFKDADLQCTRSGQVLEDFKGKSAFHLNAEEAARLAPDRAKGYLSGRAWLNAIHKRMGYSEPPQWAGPEYAKVAEALYDAKAAPWKGLNVTRADVETEPGIRVPVVFSRVDFNEKGTLVLVLHEDGIDAAAEMMAKIHKDNNHVAAIEVRGFGTTAPGKPNAKKPGHFGVDFKESFLALHLNRSLLGQRVYDLMRVIHFFTGFSADIHVVAVGSTGPVALHAVALEPRVKSLTLERSLVSWVNVTQQPVSVNQLTNVVPGALRVYDLPDLAGWLAPRQLTVRDAVDAAGQRLAQADLDRIYEPARAAYARHGKAAQLTLQANP